MGLSGLDAALSGLRVAQQQLDVISNNVANIGTAGFTRKTLPQETVVIAGASVGVFSSPIIRKVDLNLERDFWTQVSSVSNLDTKAFYLNNIQEFHGPPDAEKSVAAEVAKLRDAFISLADSPEDLYLQRATINQAVDVANKVNEFARYIDTMRNDAQEEIVISVEKVNAKLVQLADLNKQIKQNLVAGKTTAALEDMRDQIVNEVAELMEVSFFIRSDGVMVVQTSQGVQLADERPETLFFDNSVIGPSSYYPASINGIYVGGDPADNPVAIEITTREVGGKIGALIDVRDDMLPRQQALLDELAHKMAMRFDAQGLRLFTDAAGLVPADTAPVPNPPGPLTPVAYVGFSSEFQVNQAILDNNLLIQQGTVTTDIPVQSGSNEVVRRVIEFSFGEVNYQEAAGDVDLRASVGGTFLQEWLGIYSENDITGTSDVRQYSDINALFTAGGTVFQPALGPITDGFTITFEEARAVPPLGPTTVNITLTNAAANFPIGGPIQNAADQIVAEINNQIALALVPAGLAASASLSPSGQIVINSRGNITIDSSFAGGMQPEGLEFLGLVEGTSVTTDPFFEVQVGEDPPVKITIVPGEDEFDLEAKLNKIAAADPGVGGLAVDPDVTNPLGNGFLILRPGDDTTNPVFGGDLRIVGGPFTADGSGVIPGGMAAGTNIIAALFGSDSPVQDFLYTSPTANPLVNVSFRSQNLGPGVNLDTGIISSSTLIDYSQKLVNRQTEEMTGIDALRADEASFRDLLQRRFLDESGVNLDEEMANLIVIQTAYSAAARVVSAIDEQFRELLNAF